MRQLPAQAKAKRQRPVYRDGWLTKQGITVFLVAGHRTNEVCARSQMSMLAQMLQ